MIDRAATSGWVRTARPWLCAICTEVVPVASGVPATVVPSERPASKVRHLAPLELGHARCKRLHARKRSLRIYVAVLARNRRATCAVARRANRRQRPRCRARLHNLGLVRIVLRAPRSLWAARRGRRFRAVHTEVTGVTDRVPAAVLVARNVAERRKVAHLAGFHLGHAFGERGDASERSSWLGVAVPAEVCWATCPVENGADRCSGQRRRRYWEAAPQLDRWNCSYEPHCDAQCGRRQCSGVPASHLVLGVSSPGRTTRAGGAGGGHRRTPEQPARWKLRTATDGITCCLARADCHRQCPAGMHLVREDTPASHQNKQ